MLIFFHAGWGSYPVLIRYLTKSKSTNNQLFRFFVLIRMSSQVASIPSVSLVGTGNIVMLVLGYLLADM
jgi:hypothetical protein